MNKNKNIKIIEENIQNTSCIKLYVILNFVLRENKTDKQKQKNRNYQKEYKKSMTDEQKQKLKDYQKECYKKYYIEKQLNNKNEK